MDIVGGNIRKLRLGKGMRQKELAHKSGMDPSNLSKLERGGYTWTKDNLEKIADSLSVSVSAFFDKDQSVPLLGHVRAGAPPRISVDADLALLAAMDAKLDRILSVLSTDSGGAI